MDRTRTGNVVQLTMDKLQANEDVLAELDKLDESQLSSLEAQGFVELIRLERKRRKVIGAWNEALAKLAKEE